MLVPLVEWDQGRPTSNSHEHLRRGEFLRWACAMLIPPYEGDRIAHPFREERESSLSKVPVATAILLVRH